MKMQTIDDLRATVRKLKPTGSDGFEGMMAAVLTDLTKRTFALANSGSQGRGADWSRRRNPPFQANRRTIIVVNRKLRPFAIAAPIFRKKSRT